MGRACRCLGSQSLPSAPSQTHLRFWIQMLCLLEARGGGLGSMACTIPVPHSSLPALGRGWLWGRAPGLAVGRPLGLAVGQSLGTCPGKGPGLVLGCVPRACQGTVLSPRGRGRGWSSGPSEAGLGSPSVPDYFFFPLCNAEIPFPPVKQGSVAILPLLSPQVAISLQIQRSSFQCLLL